MTSQQKKIRTRRWVLGILGVALVALIGLALRPKPVPADFASVERGELFVTVDEEGETRVHDRFMVSAPVAGRVLRIEYEPGDEVLRGKTVVAVLEPSDPVPLDARSRAEAEARVGAAEAALGRARAEQLRAAAELEYAKRDLERSLELADQEIVSRKQLDAAELNVRTQEKILEAAEFAVESAEKEVQAAKAALLQAAAMEKGDGLPLLAPIDGVVLRRLRESEAVVSAGEPLIEIADPSQLEIVSDLLSTDAVKVRRGQRVLIEQWGGEEALRGVVRRVEPYGFTKISALGVEEQRVNVVVDFEDPHDAWEKLGDGYRVEVRIVIWEEPDVVKVPTGSLFRSGADWAVFVVEEDKARLRTIELGERNGLAAQVLSGLSEGDRVLLHPSDSITDGVAVVDRGV